MKRTVAVFLFLALAWGLQGAAFAADRGTAEYDRLKEVKKAQREKKEREKANPSAKAKGFWQREAERSGLAGTGAMFSNAVTGAIPLDKPNSRKQA
ncbi:MAG TPA: hypothetical protein VL404_02035 [Candidatus Eisenbacteria bacterium]|jgi:hypothetical protein|nr:hypothetical protein [Candidatus Eisenbacteria bacterium]